VVLNDDTFEEVNSYNLSLQNIYVLISSFIVVLSLLIAMAIVFTPVKKLIPGYADFQSNPTFIKLTKDLDAIQDSMAAQNLYITSIQNLLTSDGSTLKENELVVANPSVPDNIQNVSLSSSTNSELVHKENISEMSFRTPISGPISAHFDPSIEHLGIDVLAAAGTAIQATSAGHVIVSNWNIETGHTIGIQHGNNVISFYKHNLKNLKQEGEFVKAGEAIAIIGNSGTRSDGPHLHFELWYNGNPVNPEDFIIFN